jgi:TMEM175 potassium channel family protein
MSKNRVEALSDGVFAIVITLLILDIRVPDVEYNQLLSSLVALLPRILAYVISFGVIGVYWLAHHQSLQLIGRLNGFLICL